MSYVAGRSLVTNDAYVHFTERLRDLPTETPRLKPAGADLKLDVQSSCPIGQRGSLGPDLREMIAGSRSWSSVRPCCSPLAS